jgi:hypothetical protein
LDLNCLGEHARKKVLATDCLVNNDFLKTLKVPVGNDHRTGETKFAYACMILLKAK